jgi:flagellar hook-associated protein 3 FlgL
MFQRGLTAITDQQAALSKTQNQIARGTRILSPADDPGGSKRILDLQQSLELNEQFKINADAAVTRLTTQESTLDAMTNALFRVRDLVIQGNTSTLTDTDRAALAEEVSVRFQELLGLANTKDANNEYVFAGFSTDTKPFTNQTSGVSYNGDQGRKALQLGPGFSLDISDPGDEVFMNIDNGNGTFQTSQSPANNGSGVIDAGSLIDPGGFVSDTYTLTFTSDTDYEIRDSALGLVTSGTYVRESDIAFNGHQISISGAPQAGDSFTIAPSTNQSLFETVSGITNILSSTVTSQSEQADVHNALGRGLVNLDQAMNQIETVRARIGARLNAAENERLVAEEFSFQAQAAISAIRDVDLASAITRLTQQQATLEAAQRSFVAIQGLTLFDFV